MATALAHSPSDIVRKLLIDLGLATEAGTGQAWPVYATQEPDKPDNCVTIFDTAGRVYGRLMPTGVVVEHYGIQIRVRSADHKTGYQKATSIADALDQNVYFRTVQIDSNQYLVYTISRTTQVLPIGEESPETKRRLFTINALVVLRRLS